jgi:hypothetical protein
LRKMLTIANVDNLLHQPLNLPCLSPLCLHFLACWYFQQCLLSPRSPCLHFQACLQSQQFQSLLQFPLFRSSPHHQLQLSLDFLHFVPRCESLITCTISMALIGYSKYKSSFMPSGRRILPFLCL